MKGNTVMKKIFSVVTAAVIAAGMLPAAITFADDTLYNDYVPTGEIPANIIPVDDSNSPTRTYAQKIVRNTKDFEIKWDSAWSNESRFYEGATVSVVNTISANPTAGIYGLVLKNAVEFDPNTAYVFKSKLKSAGTEDVRLTMTLSNERADSISYAVEHGNEGKLIGEEFEDFTATLIPAEGYSNESGITQSLILGFAPGTKQGAAFYLDTKEKDSVYIAPETEYDIKTEVISDALDICQGGTFSVKASVLNQVGSTGNLKQHFTWKVLNEDKTEEANGFCVEGDGTDTALISVSDDTPTGKYSIVAISDDYDGFIKTATVKLNRKRITDVPFKPEAEEIPNLILVPQTNAFAVRTDKNQINADAEDDYYTVSALSDVESSNNMGMEGLKIQTVLNKGFASDFQFVSGNTYAVRARVKKSEASTEDEVYFNVALGQGTPETLAYTAQYGEQGMLLTDKWQDFKATITVSDNYDAADNKKLFYLGMPNGTKQGAAFDIEYSVYIGENSISKFECTIEDETDILTMDNSLTFYSALTNQIGLADESGDIQRYILNSERNSYVTDFITEENGSRYTVSADVVSGAGQYYFVAETVADGNIVRSSVPFTVEKPSVSECVANILNTESAAEIAPNMKRYIDALGLDFIDSDKLCGTQIANLVKESVKSAPLDESNEDELKKLMRKAMVVSLYISNPEKVELYNADGTFKYAKEMELESIDSDGVTVYSLFVSDASKEAKLNVQKELSGKDYESIPEFERSFAISAVLNTLYKPEVSGSGYVEKLLTDKNAEYTGLEISDYLEASNKSKYNLELARKKFTKETLENKIEEIKNTPPEDSGSSSGSGGKINKQPSAAGATTAKDIGESPIIYFKDVDDGHWAFADIYTLQQRGIVSGDENNEFKPDSQLTREQFVKMICELMGLKDTKTEAGFEDVDSNAWYAKYISAATQKGIITGLNDKEFGIGMPISRQDICVIVYRAFEGDMNAGELEFDDADTVSEYALSAVSYMTSIGIVNGFEDNTFRAKDNCTRAQAAKILSSIIKLKGLVKQ